MKLTLALILLATGVARAEDRALVIFPQRNKMMIATHADGHFTIRACTYVPTEAGKTPVFENCAPVGPTLPNTPLVNQDFDRQMQDVAAKLEHSAQVANRRYMGLEGAVLTTGAMTALAQAYVLHRKTGRIATFADLRRGLRVTAPLAVFMTAMFALGDLGLQVKTRKLKRAFEALAREDAPAEPLIVYDDYFDAFGVTRRVVAEALINIESKMNVPSVTQEMER